MKTRITYFAYFPKSGLYKIGSSLNPERRLRTLTGKYPLHGVHKLVGAILSSELSEAAAHTMFKPWNRTGEWYVFDSAALRKINALVPKNWEAMVPQQLGMWFAPETIASMRENFPAGSTAASAQRMIDSILAGRLKPAKPRKRRARTSK